MSFQIFWYSVCIEIAFTAVASFIYNMLNGFFLLGSLVYADNVQQLPEFNSAYGYIKNIGIPTAERIRQAEEHSNSRIVGGVPAALGQYPFMAGVLGDIVGESGVSVCGGSLISTNRVLTAAHCWYDGVKQIWQFTVVLGSVTLFAGGSRIPTSVVVSHPNWFPLLAWNDIAVIHLPSQVAVSATITPISLPDENEVEESFAGTRSIAVGFGLTSSDGDITTSQYLSHVSTNVIRNSVCSFSYPLIIQNTNICTNGLGGVGTCNGDSGGPLIVNRDNEQVLIGVTSFGSIFGCESGLPAVYTRVTSFIYFIKEQLL